MDKDTLLFIEDGSVDIDDLNQCIPDNILIIVYRQGSTRPEIIKIPDNEKEPLTKKDLEIKQLKDKYKRLACKCELFKSKVTNKRETTVYADVPGSALEKKYAIEAIMDEPTYRHIFFDD